MNSRIHFIRHGKTAGTENNLFYGWTDLPLTEDGMAEIKAQRDSGLYPPLGDADCYTSGLLRAEQTFKIIYGDQPHTQLELFKEINFGDWDGMTYDEISVQPEFEHWKSFNNITFTYPGGESFYSFNQRIRKALDQLWGYHRLKELSHRHSGKDAVSIMVCHAGVICNVMYFLFPNEKKEIMDWMPAPGHGYTVELVSSDAQKYECF